MSGERPDTDERRRRLNYEEKNSYSVTVRWTDGRGGKRVAGQSVTITVTDVDEEPEAPDAPVVGTAGIEPSSVRVSWDEPANTGPPITDYDVQYRKPEAEAVSG